MNQNRTEIVVILDRSGSMSATKHDAEGGFNAFIDEQKKLPGGFLTLTQFGNAYEIVYANRPLEQVPPLNLTPRGNTALLDAIGRTINETGKRLADTAEADRPGKVVCVIITDGEENASREFTRTQVAEMVKHQTEKYGWQFVYIGANQDAIAAAATVGISSNAAMSYAANAAGTRSSYKAVSRGVMQCRASGEAVAFSATDRADAMSV